MMVFAIWTHYVLGPGLALLSVFLILLVLVQRGRGGGLVGALGGPGGSSALGTKAGDTFTRVTIGVAAAWFLLCMLAIVVLNSSANSKLKPSSGSTTTSGDANAKSGDGGDAADGDAGANDGSSSTPGIGGGTSGSSDEGDAGASGNSGSTSSGDAGSTSAGDGESAPSGTGGSDE